MTGQKAQSRYLVCTRQDGLEADLEIAVAASQQPSPLADSTEPNYNQVTSEATTVALCFKIIEPLRTSIIHGHGSGKGSTTDSGRHHGTHLNPIGCGPEGRSPPESFPASHKIQQFHQLSFRTEQRHQVIEGGCLRFRGCLVAHASASPRLGQKTGRRAMVRQESSPGRNAAPSLASCLRSWKFWRGKPESSSCPAILGEEKSGVECRLLVDCR